MSIIKLVTWSMSFEIPTEQPDFISNANRWMLIARFIYIPLLTFLGFKKFDLHVFLNF